MNNRYFEYGQDEIDYLSKKDKKMGLAIKEIGMLERVVIPDLFVALVSSIVSQQISNKACDTVWARLGELLGDVTAENIKKTDISDIQKCGMSMRKASYIKGVAEADVDFEALKSLPDKEIIAILSSLHGVGVWTAEMMLIFSLQRPDVVSYGDLAIRRGMMNLYGLCELPKDEFAKYAKRYSPYGSVASLYLWALSVQ